MRYLSTGSKVHSTFQINIVAQEFHYTALIISEIIIVAPKHIFAALNIFVVAQPLYSVALARLSNFSCRTTSFHLPDTLLWLNVIQVMKTSRVDYQ